MLSELPGNAARCRNCFGLLRWGVDDHVLRPLGPGDLSAFRNLVMEGGEMRWERSPATAEEVERLLSFRLDHYAERGFGVLGVWTEGETDLLGQAGLQALDGASEDVELVVFLSRRVRGRGLASRLSHWFLDRAFNSCGLSVVWATVRPDNGPALALTSSLGFVPAGRRHHYGYESILYRLDRSSWPRDPA